MAGSRNLGWHGDCMLGKDRMDKVIEQMSCGGDFLGIMVNIIKKTLKIERLWVWTRSKGWKNDETNEG